MFACGYVHAQMIGKNEALIDFNDFKRIIKTESSYYQLSDYDFESHFDKIQKVILESDSIPVYYLAHEFEKIISQTIDRHAHVRMRNFDKSKYETLDNYLPFAVAPYEDKVLALMPIEKTNEYKFYIEHYPFIKSINGIDVKTFLDTYSYRTSTSPVRAKLEEDLRNFKNIGELYFRNNKILPDSLNIVFTDGENDKQLKMPLSRKKHHWVSLGSFRYSDIQYQMAMEEDFDFNSLDKWLSDSIAYIGIPHMISYERYPEFPAYLNSTIEKYRNSKALIIDLRGNGGGTRDILNTFSGYFIGKDQSPWVANVAYVRCDQSLNEDISSMQSRYLYNYHSSFLTNRDREAIDTFNETFKTEVNFDKEKFSSPFYMVLKSGCEPLDCPVYLLVNEECFSATSVFTSAFKGVENVTIVGVTTNGSSGRSQKYILDNSKIEIKLSTMLSFQRNGKTLDGNGTEPDMEIDKDMEQILGKRDSQLENLIELINRKN